MSENYLGIITENYEWELSQRIMSGNYRLRIMTQYIRLHGKVEIYRDTGVSKKQLNEC